MNQPEPMVGNPLDFVEIVSLISNPPILDKQLVNIFTVTVTTFLQDLRVGMLKLLILDPLFSLSPHDGLERAPSQGYTAVEVFRQVVESLGTGVLNPFDHVKGFRLHDFELGSQVCQVPFRTFSLMKMVRKQLVQDNLGTHTRTRSPCNIAQRRSFIIAEYLMARVEASLGLSTWSKSVIPRSNSLQ